MSTATYKERENKAAIAERIMPPTAGNLLETVKYNRAMTGDALEDDEFSFLMLQKHLPTEADFEFLCFRKGCVTLSVPLQDDACWHPAHGWISPEKEKVAALLAKKYKLMLSEPPDAGLRSLVPCGMAIRHHIQLWNRKETIVIAHPEFLKVRLYASDTGLVFPPVPGLLKDLAALYRPQRRASLACQLDYI
jgi:hypothetical protein